MYPKLPHKKTTQKRPCFVNQNSPKRNFDFLISNFTLFIPFYSMLGAGGISFLSAFLLHLRNGCTFRLRHKTLPFPARIAPPAPTLTAPRRINPFNFARPTLLDKARDALYSLYSKYINIYCRFTCQLFIPLLVKLLCADSTITWYLKRKQKNTLSGVALKAYLSTTNSAVAHAYNFLSNSPTPTYTHSHSCRLRR